MKKSLVLLLVVVVLSSLGFIIVLSKQGSNKDAANNGDNQTGSVPDRGSVADQKNLNVNPSSDKDGGTDPKQPKDQTSQGEEVSLFNGSTLDGWSPVFLSYTKNREANPWHAVPAEHVLASDAGDFVDLETKQSFKDFTLKLEWRFPPGASVGVNGSGIVVRSSGLHPNKLDPQGIEIDLLNHKNEQEARGTGCFVCYGAVLKNQWGEADGDKKRHLGWLREPSLKEQGEWNSCEIECNGDRIKVRMNGVLVNEAWGAEEVAGKIVLRCQNTQVEFRNLTVRQIAQKPKVEPAKAKQDDESEKKEIARAEREKREAAEMAERKRREAFAKAEREEKAAKLDANGKKADPARTPTAITADFLPHKPGTRQYYDTQMNLPDGKASVLRSMVIQKEDGVIASTSVRVGSLNAGESILKGDKVKWLKDVNQPLSPKYHRIKGDYIEHGSKNEFGEDILWERVLKIGARDGDTWEWESLSGTVVCKATVGGTHAGKPAVVIHATWPTSVAMTQTLKYVKGVGEVERISVITFKNGKKHTGVIKLVEEGRKQEVGEGNAQEQSHTGFVTSVSFSPDGKRLASGSVDKTVKLWDVASGQNTATFNGHTSSVNSLSFNPDGKTLASGSGDKTILLWDVANGKNTATLIEGLKARLAIDKTPVSFSLDGKRLASGSMDKTIKLWDVANGKTTTTLEGHTGVVAAVSFSPDGKTLASGSWDETVKLWDVASGKNTATFKGHTSFVNSVSFSPDGKTLASGSLDKTIKLWDVQSGKVRATLTGHTADVRSVSFSPDGKTLASGSLDKTIKLWDVANGKSIATLQGHKRGVSSVSFSPDGKTLASGSADNTVKLWDVASGKNTATLAGAH